jgi:hypothetical protein
MARLQLYEATGTFCSGCTLSELSRARDELHHEPWGVTSTRLVAGPDDLKVVARIA